MNVRARAVLVGHLGLLVLMFLGCGEPRCPRNLVQDGTICRRCPEGARVEKNMCVLPDSGAPSGDAGSDAGEGEPGEDSFDGSDRAQGDGSASNDGGAEDSATSDAQVVDSAANAGAVASLDAGVDAGVLTTTCDGGPAICGCPTGTKLCGSSCVAEAQCCSECPSGTRCSSGQCKSWCDEQTRPVNVVAADYQCLDFDRGLPPGATWVRSPAGKGTVAISTTRASSAPNSLETSAPAGDTADLADEATLKWRASGSTPIASVSVSMGLSPANHPSIVPQPLSAELICVTNANGKVCLSYSYGASVGTIDGAADNYRGLYVSQVNFNGAFIPHDCIFAGSPTSPALNSNVWNAVTFDVRRTSVEVSVNGTKAQLGTCGSDLGMDTNADIILGLQDSWGWSVLYDNVQVSVLR